MEQATDNRLVVDTERKANIVIVATAETLAKQALTELMLSPTPNTPSSSFVSLSSMLFGMEIVLRHPEWSKGILDLFYGSDEDNAREYIQQRIDKLVSGMRDGNDCVDVRLQVLDDGNWTLHTGLADYDLDHHGYWGASSIPFGRANMRNIAVDLLEQVYDDFYTHRLMRTR